MHKDWKDSRWLSFVLKILLVVGMFFLILIAVSWIFGQIVNYVIANLDWIVFTGIVGICFVSAIKARFEAKKDNKTNQVPETPIKNEDVIEQLNDNYMLLRDGLFKMLKHIAPVLKITCPQYDYEIESDRHYYRQGNIVSYEYIIYKTADVAIDLFKSVLQKEIDLNLAKESISGIAQKFYIYEGQSISLIKVHDIEDCGAFYRVKLAIVNEDYCKYMEHNFKVDLKKKAITLKAPTDKDF